MTLVDLNTFEIMWLVKSLELQKSILENGPLPEDIENSPKEIQSIIYKLQKVLEE
jgi:hypothetical protein